ncbi:hypothetical protein EJ04DRAFT_511618 [Polyplosphaeria fusca]|uniref:Uncharacterized protein n=1 Tax=Polyplosphaeria fusca TaxID=682080 RepID=A0A9P4R2L9_9PLEO|nr:hypothetical protein EJ04DRAFT_511618 [Polyplosphaeria fusca]
MPVDPPRLPNQVPKEARPGCFRNLQLLLVPRPTDLTKALIGFWRTLVCRRAANQVRLV